MSEAVSAISAPAYEGRLVLFLERVWTGAEGLAAGKVSPRVRTTPSTLSASLTRPAHAGLVRYRREGWLGIDRAACNHVAEPLGALAQHCCRGRPQVCTPLAAIAGQLASCA